MKPGDFIVGQHYENYKGVYEVLGIEGEVMRICWDQTGEEVSTTRDQQARIIQRIQKERLDAARGLRGKPSTTYGRLFSGLQKSDFREDPTGTTWRSREQLGGAVTRHLEARGLVFQSWSIYKWQMVHWADVVHRAEQPAWFQAKLVAHISAEMLTYGFYAERPDSSQKPRADWTNLMTWLSAPAHAAWLSRTICQGAMVLREWCGRFPERFRGTEAGDWRVATPEGEVTRPVGFLWDFIASRDPGKWVDLVVVKERAREEAIADGSAIAAEMADTFNALMPLYRVAIGLAQD